MKKTLLADIAVDNMPHNNLVKLAKKIGPLRYQSSEADCVPTTVINGLLMITQARVHPKLQQLIFSIALDKGDSGTGWVCSHLLAQALQSWADFGKHDEYFGEKDMSFKSCIFEGTEVNIDKVSGCLDSGGVICLTIKKGTHYTLLHTHVGERFFGFDPYWPPKIAAENDFGAGLINVSWTKSELEDLLKIKRNQWIHAITPYRASAAK